MSPGLDYDSISTWKCSRQCLRAGFIIKQHYAWTEVAKSCSTICLLMLKSNTP